MVGGVGGRPRMGKKCGAKKIPAPTGQFGAGFRGLLGPSLASLSLQCSLERSLSLRLSRALSPTSSQGRLWLA